MIPIYINNNFLLVPKYFSVFDACEKFNLIIPRFCYHSQLNIAGNCRMCLVEIEKAPKPIASCAFPITKNMRIYSNSPLVKKARENVIEFLLLNHPLDCPICDQGGECDLQDQTVSFGSDRTRFFNFKRGVVDKDLGPIIKTIMNRCIHCTRCIRFISDITGFTVLGTVNRGKTTEISSYVENSLQNELSGNLVDICPVGALTSKPFAFSSRPWELLNITTIDFCDGVGSNIFVDLKENEILRIQPKQNDLINRNWLSNKSRFFFDALKNNRLNSIFLKCSFNYKMVSFFWCDFILIIKKIIKYLFLQNSFSNKILLNNKFYYSAFLNNFSVILNDFISIENMFDLKHFSNCFGIKNFGNIYLKNGCNKNDLNKFYSSLFKIKELSNNYFCLLIGTNPRFESSVFNIQLKKRFSFGIFVVVSCTPFVNCSFPIIFIGISSIFIIKISEGKSNFCKHIFIKKTIIFIGYSIFNRLDSNTFINVVFIIEKIVNKFINKINIYFINNNVNSVGYFFTNLNGINKLFLYKTKIFFLIEPQINKLGEIGCNLFYNKNKVILSQSYFGDNNKNFKFDLIVPVLSIFECTGTFISFNNTIQQSNVVTNINNGHNFFLQKCVLKILKLILYLYYHNFLKVKISIIKNKKKHVVFSKNIIQSFVFYNDKYFSFKNRVTKYPFIIAIYDFYNDSNFSIFSNILNKCSKINRINHNNFINF